MEIRTLLFSALLAAMMVMVHAQPQYRVSVNAPAVTIAAIPGNIPEETVVFSLCFREAGSADRNASYCPLGLHEETPGVDAPPEVLGLRDGAESLPAAYPRVRTIGPNPMTVFQGVGVLVTIRGGGMTIGTQIMFQANGSPFGTGEPGTVINIPTTMVEGVIYTARFMINCVPEFTGSDCTIPVQIATMAPPTTTVPSATPPPPPPLTTPAPPTTTAPPTAPPMPTTAPLIATVPPTTTALESSPAGGVSSTEAAPATTATAEASEDTVSSTGIAESQTSPSVGGITNRSSDEDCPSPALLMGIGIAIGFGTATLIALLAGTIITTCCLVKMGKKRGSSGASSSGDEDEIIKTTSNPLYGAELEGQKGKADHLYDEVQYRENSGAVPHPEGHGGYDEDHSTVPHPGGPQSHYEIPLQRNHSPVPLPDEVQHQQVVSPGGHRGYDEVQHQQGVPPGGHRGYDEVQHQQGVPPRGHRSYDEVRQQNHTLVPLPEGRSTSAQDEVQHGENHNAAPGGGDEVQSHSAAPLSEGHSHDDEDQQQENYTAVAHPYEVPLHSAASYQEGHSEEERHDEVQHHEV